MDHLLGDMKVDRVHFQKWLICIGLLVLVSALLHYNTASYEDRFSEPGPFPDYTFELDTFDSSNGTGLDFSADYIVMKRPRRPVARNKSYYSSPVRQSLGDPCMGEVKLKLFTKNQSVDGQMFFIETSGKKYLTPRQACAVESAVLRSQLEVKVLLTASVLSLDYNVTCYLYNTYKNTLRFYSIQIPSALRSTPLEKLWRSGSLKKSSFPTAHSSDALRLALLYKYGGFYSDLDSVTIRSLRDYRNVVGSTSSNAEASTKLHVANGELQLQAGHQLLLFNMNLFVQRFRGKNRVEVGPMLTTRAIKELYKVDDIAELDLPDLRVLPPSVFFPVRAFEAKRLWPTKSCSFEEWAELFENSTMVHFYASLTDKLIVDRNPGHQAYALLAPRYCPVVYKSSDDF